jgi:hypothetical protein
MIRLSNPGVGDGGNSETSGPSRLKPEVPLFARRILGACTFVRSTDGEMS